MKIEQFYNEIGEDLEEIQESLGLPDAFIEKFVTKFYEDKNFARLEQAMENKNLKEIEISAHTLKGSALNLGFTAFTQSSKAMVEAVRSGEIDKLDVLFEEVKKDYTNLINAYEHATK